MTLDELKSELYGNMHDFATKLSENHDSKNQFVKETRKDYDSWVKKQKKDMKRKSQKRGVPSSEESTVSQKELGKRQRNFLFPQDCAIPVNSVESFVLWELIYRN